MSVAIEQRDLFIKHIFSSVAPYVDLLSSGFSLGIDNFWRTKAVSLSGIREGERVLDVCTGTGKLALLLSRKVGPRGSVTGADFCEEMLSRARRKTGKRYRNMSYILSDAKQLPFPDNTFDAVTVAFGMRNIPDTSMALTELHRVLKPGGKYICLELTKPSARWLRAIYEWYVFRVMPVVAEVVVKTAAPYLYLPRSINAFYPPDEFKRIIAETGFAKVTVDSLTMGIATIYRAVKRG
jgi:demethylmenaquinone methyltransferase/2-methoxy-6-polyprenyl-1,4-benzoquinol methylase